MAVRWPLEGRGRLVEPQQRVFRVPLSRAGVGQNDIHPMRRGGVKSFVDDLVLGRGVVISRAATSLRSVETQPLTRRFVRARRATPSPFGQAAGSPTTATEKLPHPRPTRARRVAQVRLLPRAV